MCGPISRPDIRRDGSLHPIVHLVFRHCTVGGHRNVVLGRTYLPHTALTGAYAPGQKQQGDKVKSASVIHLHIFSHIIEFQLYEQYTKKLS